MQKRGYAARQLGGSVAVTNGVLVGNGVEVSVGKGVNVGNAVSVGGGVNVGVAVGSEPMTVSIAWVFIALTSMVGEGGGLTIPLTKLKQKNAWQHMAIRAVGIIQPRGIFIFGF